MDGAQETGPLGLVWTVWRITCYLWGLDVQENTVAHRDWIPSAGHAVWPQLAYRICLQVISSGGWAVRAQFDQGVTQTSDLKRPSRHVRSLSVYISWTLSLTAECEILYYTTLCSIIWQLGGGGSHAMGGPLKKNRNTKQNTIFQPIYLSLYIPIHTHGHFITTCRAVQVVSGAIRPAPKLMTPQHFKHDINPSGGLTLLSGFKSNIHYCKISLLEGKVSVDAVAGQLPHCMFACVWCVRLSHVLFSMR